jgi:hypothetical protein
MNLLEVTRFVAAPVVAFIVQMVWPEVI